MKVIYPNLHRMMIERGITDKDLARHCDISRLSCLLKLSGFSPWTFTEVMQICQLFDVVDAESLFVRLDIIS